MKRIMSNYTSLQRHPHVKDLIGKKFGYMLVLSLSHVQADGRSMWRCMCDCGKIKLVAGNNLTNGTIISCGCYRCISHRAKVGQHGFITLWTRYKQSAKRRKLSFTLTQLEFTQLVTGNCYYCNAVPSQSALASYYKKIYTTEGIKNGQFYYNGIDRVDNTCGYNLKNCVSCCKFCNIAKSNMTVAEFRAWIFRVYEKIRTL